MSFPSPGTDPAPNVDPDPDESKLHRCSSPPPPTWSARAWRARCFPSRASARGARRRARPPPAPRTPAADFRCHAPVTLFRRLLARATRGGAPRETEPLPRRALGEDFGDESGEDEIRVFADEIVRTSEKQTSAIRVVSVSSYGTVRSRAYASAEALADAIVEAADPLALGAPRRRRPSRETIVRKRGRRGSARSRRHDERVYDRIKHGDVCFRERRHTRHTRNTRRARIANDAWLIRKTRDLAAARRETP